MEKNLVVKANKLNESRYKLSVQEQRVVLTMISLIKPSDSDFMPYRFSIKEFMDITGVKGHGTYTELKKVTNTLMKKTFTITKPSGDLQIGWVSSAEYFYQEGRLELCFDPKLKPYLLALQSEFTRYQLKNIIRLKSLYSIRIYELLKQYQSVGTRYFDLQDLRSILCVSENKLKLYSNFRAKVIEKAKLDLIKTDIIFTYEPVKSGRCVTGLKFFIKQNAPVVKKSYKRKAAPQVEKSPVVVVKDSAQDLENNLLNDKLNLLMAQYPKHYETLLKHAEKRLSGQEKAKPGLNLTIRFKMLALLPGFIQKNKIKF